MKKLIASALAAALLTSALTGPASAAKPAFSDVPERHWAYECVAEMAEKGIVNGTGDGRFNPSGTVSAAEFLAMAGRAFFSEALANYSGGGDDWFTPYFFVAQYYDLLDGTSITYDSMTAPLTRYEMAALTKNICIYEGVYAGGASASQIKDYDSVPTEDLQLTLLYCYAAHVLNGDANGFFNGDSTLTRAEAATILSRIIHAERLPDEIRWAV